MRELRIGMRDEEGTSARRLAPGPRSAGLALSTLPDYMGDIERIVDCMRGGLLASDTPKSTGCVVEMLNR